MKNCWPTVCLNLDCGYVQERAQGRAVMSSGPVVAPMGIQYHNQRERQGRCSAPPPNLCRGFCRVIPLLVWWKSGQANTGTSGCQQRRFLVTGKYLEEKGICFLLKGRKEEDSLWSQRDLRRHCLLLLMWARAPYGEPTSPSCCFPHLWMARIIEL